MTNYIYRSIDDNSTYVFRDDECVNIIGTNYIMYYLFGNEKTDLRDLVSISSNKEPVIRGGVVADFDRNEMAWYTEYSIMMEYLERRALDDKVTLDDVMASPATVWDSCDRPIEVFMINVGSHNDVINYEDDDYQETLCPVSEEQLVVFGHYSDATQGFDERVVSGYLICDSL